MREAYNAQEDIDGFIAWVEFLRWLREFQEDQTGAKACIATSKPTVSAPAEPDDQSDGSGAHCG